jgi:hypothetical protein
MRLAHLQRLAQNWLLGAAPLPAALAGAVQAPAEERWQVYHDAYRLRLVEALATQYPVLAARLGAQAFDARMRAYIDAYPSVHRSIRDYGGELGEFLGAAATDAEGRMCAELARFEWQLAAAFDAPDVVALAPADLASVAPGDWAGLRFAGVPSLRRLTTATNAVACWRAGQTEAGAAPIAAAAPPAEWLIFRPQLTTEFRSLPSAEAVALDRLLGGESFGELCAALAATEGEGAALAAASLLKGWLVEGLLVRL